MPLDRVDRNSADEFRDEMGRLWRRIPCDFCGGSGKYPGGEPGEECGVCASNGYVEELIEDVMPSINFDGVTWVSPA